MNRRKWARPIDDDWEWIRELAGPVSPVTPEVRPPPKKRGPKPNLRRFDRNLDAAVLVRSGIAAGLRYEAAVQLASLELCIGEKSIARADTVYRGAELKWLTPDEIASLQNKHQQG